MQKKKKRSTEVKYIKNDCSQSPSCPHLLGFQQWPETQCYGPKPSVDRFPFVLQLLHVKCHVWLLVQDWWDILLRPTWTCKGGVPVPGEDWIWILLVRLGPNHHQRWLRSHGAGWLKRDSIWYSRGAVWQRPVRPNFCVFDFGSAVVLDLGIFSVATSIR